MIDALEPRCFLSVARPRSTAAAPIPRAAPPLATTLQFGATAFVENAAGTIVYATVPAAGQVVAINESTLKVSSTFNIGGKPTGLALSTDGKTLYVADNSSNNIDVIATATGAIGTHLIDFYPLLYTQNPVYPGAALTYGMVPFLSFKTDDPGLALGYQLPAFHVAIEVVK